jgi:bifunctional non-homologous end joining protein LigD
MTTAAAEATYSEERADLECRMGGSDKVYHIQLTQSEAGWQVTAQNGPRGGTLTPQKPKIKDALYPDAKKVFDKLVAEKLKGKGDGTNYSHMGKPPGAAPIAPNLSNSRGPVSPDVVFHPELLTRITELEARRFATDTRYMFQTKQDGDRLTVRVHGESIHGYNKLGQVVRLDPQLHAAIFRLVEPSAITQLLIDGEWEPTGFYAWDLLECTADIRQRPYFDRLDLLQTLLDRARLDRLAIDPGHLLHVTYTAHTTEEKLALLGNRKLEGIAVKDCKAAFRPGRNGQHKKFKFEQTASFLVGPKPASKANDGHRSVALYLFDPEATPALRYVSTVKVPEKYELPQLDAIVEVRYLYAYKGGGIAQPCYFGKVRRDVRPQDCTTAQLKWKDGEEADEHES